jgi:16S rRNA pseudouridine516 synthase
MRLIKFLTLSVAMSRNQAKFFIRKGRASVDGKTRTDPNFELLDSSHVVFDGKAISVISYQYLMLHKPSGFTCGAKDKKYISALELVKNRSKDRRYYFANAVTPEFTGIVLISDDIRWISRLKLKLQKKTGIYQVRLKNIFRENQLQQLQKAWIASAGNKIGTTIEIKKQNERTILLSVSQSRAADIMRMLTSVDFEIETLQLQQIGRLSLGSLKEGDCLQLAASEIKV